MHDATDTADTAVPLFVDLDGTLLKSDLLVESAFALLKRAPLIIFPMLMWLLHGKARLKAEIAQRASLETAALPFQKDFLAWLRGEAAQRPVWLASASDARLVTPIAEHLGLFAGVLASDGRRNLAGAHKREAILEVTGGGAFDYAGNARPDLAIWARARRAVVVNPEPGIERAARAGARVERVFDDRPPALRAYLRALRVHQWMKNLLLGVPVLTAHAWSDGDAIGAAIVAFVAFGLCASATYLLNDLLDLPADRVHPSKSRRPLAAGDLPLMHAVLLMPALLATGLGLAATLPSAFPLTLLAYLVLTVSYSLHFKTYMLIDVILLAGLYTVRIVAGAFAINVAVSSWLLAFSTFMFMSLALVKRCSELLTLERLQRTAARGRDYRVSDLPCLGAMGVSSGYLAVLVLALFIDSPGSVAHYTHVWVLWLLCPLMLYWVSRLWIKTWRGEMHEDPLVYSLRDRASWIILVAMAAITVAAA